MAEKRDLKKEMLRKSALQVMNTLWFVVRAMIMACDGIGKGKRLEIAKRRFIEFQQIIMML